MIYFFTIVFPPLGVLLAGKPLTALLNLGLYFLFIFPAYIHAFAVVHDSRQAKRIKKQTKQLLKGMFR